jgi:hypothetical protein
MPVEAMSSASSSRDNGCAFSFDSNENVPDRKFTPAATRRERRPKIASHSGYSRAAFNPSSDVTSSFLPVH